MATLVANLFYDEVAGGEPVAGLAVLLDDVAVKCDTIGEVAVGGVVGNGDVVEVDAVPAVAHTTMCCTLVDIESQTAIAASDIFKETAEGREPHITASITIGWNLLLTDGVTHLCKDHDT